MGRAGPGSSRGAGALRRRTLFVFCTPEGMESKASMTPEWTVLKPLVHEDTGDVLLIGPDATWQRLRETLGRGIQAVQIDIISLTPRVESALGFNYLSTTLK